MLVRNLRAVLTTCTLLLSAATNTAQFVVSTPKPTIAVGEALVVGEKYVNATGAPLSYSTFASDGSYATIQYLLERVDLENNVMLPPPFEVQRGAEVLRVRTLRFHSVSSGFSGVIGPGQSQTMGGTLGFGVPVNLLRAAPVATGTALILITEDNRALTLSAGERLVLRTTGPYLLTALAEGVRINGHEYRHSTTGYLVAQTFVDVVPRSGCELGLVGVR